METGGVREHLLALGRDMLHRGAGEPYVEMAHHAALTTIFWGGMRVSLSQKSVDAGQSVSKWIEAQCPLIWLEKG